MTITKKGLRIITLTVVDCGEFNVGDKKTLFAIVPTSSFLNLDLPNDANSRDFTGSRNKQVKAMKYTLEKEPEMFRLKNLGIRIIASDYKLEGNELKLYFDKHEGIVNGGHTNETLKKFGVPNAYVNITVDLSIPPEAQVGVSLSLNMSKFLKPTSQGEKIGRFNWLKEIFSDLPVVYKEGGKGEFPVEDILAVANLFKVDKLKEKYADSLGETVRNKGKIVQDNNTYQMLTYTSGILRDMWDLYREIKTNKFIMNIIDEEVHSGNKKRWFRKNELIQGLALIYIYGVRLMTELNDDLKPTWSKGYDKETALRKCEECTLEIVDFMKKESLKEVNVESIYKMEEFQKEVLKAFLTVMYIK